jgi:hypothetical protein
MLSHHLGNARERAAEVKKFEWARKTTDLLCQLDGVLCETIEAWLSFNEDLAYFSDITPEAQRALRSIQKIFRQLQGSQKRLLLLKNYCSGFLSDVSQSPSCASWKCLLSEKTLLTRKHIVKTSLKS